LLRSPRLHLRVLTRSGFCVQPDCQTSSRPARRSRRMPGCHWPRIPFPARNQRPAQSSQATVRLPLGIGELKKNSRGRLQAPGAIYPRLPTQLRRFPAAIDQITKLSHPVQAPRATFRCPAPVLPGTSLRLAETHALMQHPALSPDESPRGQPMKANLPPVSAPQGLGTSRKFLATGLTNEVKGDTVSACGRGANVRVQRRRVLPGADPDGDMPTSRTFRWQRNRPRRPPRGRGAPFAFRETDIDRWTTKKQI